MEIMRKMKRKVAKLSGFRLSPNEEALLIKEEQERRRRLRIKQVREQERFIAEQIREKVKQCRNQQLEQLANELKTEWQLAQGEKTKSLEKLYLSSLKAIGEGHRQAQENEPDLKIQSKQAAINREKAERRHREALRELKQQREKEHEVQTRYIKTRKKALLIEKKRAITIAHLPPPPPNPFADLEVPKYPTVKMYDIDSFSATHYHLPEPCVNREMNSKQVSARLTAEMEEKRLEELKQEAEMEKQEQLEKARLRGSCALQLVHLIQDKEKLIKELEQMQLADLTRRRQAVSQMPQKLFEPPYRRVEINKDRQKEMEIAFEDMYADDKKIKGDVLLRLEPEPLPAPSVETQDEDLDISEELEGFQEQQSAKGDQEESEIKHFRKTEVSPLTLPSQSSSSPSKAALMKLLTKIRKQKDHCVTRSESNSVNEEVTINSGSITVEESKQTTLAESTSNANLSEERSEVCSVLPDNNYQRETSEETIVAGNTTLFHPKEQANRIRSDVDRIKQLHDLEQQKQEQLALLWQSEHQKHDLETNLRISQLQQLQGAAQLPERLMSDSERQTWQENEQLKHSKSIVSSEVSPEDEIHQYLQHLIEQNRLHKTSVEETREQLNEYLLEKGLPSDSTSASCLPAQNCHNEPRAHINVNHSPLVVHGESKHHPDLLRSERHGFEVNGVEVLEPCLTILDAVESEQVLSHVGLMEDQLKSIQTQPGTTEIAEERLKQSVCSLPLTRPIEILRNQERVSTSSVDLSFQQEHLKGLQQQLWRQRQDLLATQKLQQEFICRQNQLMEQMQQQQYQGMEKKWTGNQSGHLAIQEVMPTSENVKQLPLMPYPMCSFENFNTGSTNKNPDFNNEEQDKGSAPSVQINEALLPFWYYDFKTEQAGSCSTECSNVEAVIRETRHYKRSKPPVTKTRLGLCGLIDQHELSSIQEMESPKSDRLSMYVDRMPKSNDCCKSVVKELLPSIMDPPHSSEVMELDLSNISTHSSQNSSVPNSTAESIRTGRMTWREKLNMETGSLPVQASLSKSPSCLAKIESNGLEYSDPASLPCNINCMVFPHYSKDTCSFNAVEKTCEVDQTSTTTLSTGSFPLHEQTTAGPLNSGDYQCTIDNIPSRQSTPTSPSYISNLPPSFPEYQYTMKAQSNAFTTNEEKSTSNESSIEKLIEKYTQDLSKLLDSGGKCQDSATACDISNLEFPNLSLEQHNCQQDSNFEFQPLECRSDFSIYSSSLSLTSSKNSNFPSSDSTSENQHSIPTATSDKESSSSCAVSTPASGITASDIDQVENHVQQSYEGNSNSNFFQPVHLEITPREYNSNTDRSSENLEQEFHNENSTNTEYVPSDLSRAGRVVADSLTVDSINQSSNCEPAIEKLRVGDGENSQEHADTFFRLNGTLTTGTESDVGIMEEPELTQLTLNESTLLDDELSQEFGAKNITTEDNLNEIQASSQTNGMHPVIPVNTSSESRKSEVMIFEFEPSAKILNEAVLKRKQKFLANSAKRMEDLKKKEKSGIVKSELYARPISHEQGQSSGFASSSSVATHLKMVGEVKVTTPEDRKAVEAEMRQRTLRLYSQLEEVKNKKREVNRQTVCTRNREKAKEFQKRTLEKLRANRVRK
ncbi:centrosomal protein of 295 kDa isoform X2 [Hypanus sabinus]|uniref:centrosomal protein of 295 kDa isoform X2 n=1 Tax=Hypanus sabinus TaxID=79690 RepID=UPI0028C4E718|nr:centrosomal protein of 295 kDa isoform X2 [Hypanus sabinus]